MKKFLTLLLALVPGPDRDDVRLRQDQHRRASDAGHPR